MQDARRHAPATARNRDPILAVLRRHLPENGLLLEVSAGTGEHAVHFATAFPALVWQPTDPYPGARASIAAWAREAKLNTLRPPLALDAAAEDWPVARADAVLCINIIEKLQSIEAKGYFQNQMATSYVDHTQSPLCGGRFGRGRG
jgi:hypothetical protein